MERLIIAASSRLLRNPHHESFLARYWNGKGLSASATADEIGWMPYPWHVDGNAIWTHAQEELDIERMYRSVDPLTYSMDGDLIHVEKIFDRDGMLKKADSSPLLNTNWCFHADRKRTMLRFLAKADEPRSNRVSASLLSLMFWADVSKRIQDEE